MRKAKLGPDHPDTLHSMNNLAMSYAAAGQIRARCSSSTRRRWLCKRRSSAPTTPTRSRSMNNLANSYADAGQYERALKLHEETLALRKTKLGPDHPDTLMSMNNLAASYAAAGQNERAPDAL